MPYFDTPWGTRFRIGILIGLFLDLGDTVFAQDKQVKKESVKQTLPLSGASTFKEYCAVSFLGRLSSIDGTPNVLLTHRCDPKLS
jgi:hypothetical protein